MKLTNCKELAIRNFIYLWLQDSRYYCNNCGEYYVEPPEGIAADPCCEHPHMVTNYTAMVLLLAQNKAIRETRLNQYGSTKDKRIRLMIGMTQKMWQDIEEYCINTLKEPFLKDDKEAQDFVRAFPQFQTCEVI